MQRAGSQSAILLGMSRYDPQPARESSRTVVIVLLSLVILTVIGALLGYVLGTRDIDMNELPVDDGKSPTAAWSVLGHPEWPGLGVRP